MSLERYGIPLVAKSLLTTARQPDEQAAVEKSTHTLLAALAGARIFTNAGFLAVDDYISAAQIVVDCEIVQHVWHVLQGLPVDDEPLAAGVIREVSLSNRNFLEHETTLQNYRQASWDPSLFTRISLKVAERQKMLSLEERARQIARQHIAAADYVLGEADRSILQQLYQRAKNKFG